MNCPDAPERLTWVETCERYPDAWVLLAEDDEEDRVIRSARVLDFDESMIAIMDRNDALPRHHAEPDRRPAVVVVDKAAPHTRSRRRSSWPRAWRHVLRQRIAPLTAVTILYLGASERSTATGFTSPSSPC